MRSTQKWPLKTDELGIPNYTGAVLTGAYVAVDIAGPVSGLTFGQAALIARTRSDEPRLHHGYSKMAPRGRISCTGMNLERRKKCTNNAAKH
jgi:hypothetical protein